MTLDRLLTPEETAEWLGITPNKLGRMSRRGEIPVVWLDSKTRRYRYQDIDKWLKDKEIKERQDNDSRAI